MNNRCGCSPKPTFTPPKSNYQIHQLERLNEAGEKYDIFPNTVVQAVYDLETGESLRELLLKHNHVALSFNTDFETTVKQVPTSQRRRGLIVTFVNCSGKIKHYQYNGCNSEYVNFTNRTNWSEFPSITEEDWQKIKDLEVYYQPTGLSYNPHTKTLEFTYVDKQNVTHTLCTPLNLEDTWHKIETVKVNGSNLVITQKNSNGSVQEFSVALPQATIVGKGNTITVPAPSTGRCGNKNPQTITYTDTYITAVRVDGNNLILERNDSTELGVELPKATNNTTNDGPTRAEFDTLKGIVEELPTCDCEDLKAQIRGLVSRIEALERRPDPVIPPATVDTNKYVTRGEWINDTTVRLHFNDNTYIDIVKPNTPTLEPKKEITLTITASNTSGIGSVKPVISVSGTEGNDPITEPIELLVNGQPYNPNTTYESSTILDVVAIYKDKEERRQVPINVSNTTTYKIKYGFLRSDDPNQKPTIANLTREMEVESIANGVIIPIPTEAPSRGRYIYAIEKPLIANGYTAYMQFNGQYALLTEEETEKSDVQIDGRNYTLYIDYLTNREFTDPLNIKVTN